MLIELADNASDTVISDINLVIADSVGSIPDLEVGAVLFGQSSDFWAIRHPISDALARSGMVDGFDIAVKRWCLPNFRAEGLALLALEFLTFEVCDLRHCDDRRDHFSFA